MPHNILHISNIRRSAACATLGILLMAQLPLAVFAQQKQPAQPVSKTAAPKSVKPSAEQPSASREENDAFSRIRPTKSAVNLCQQLVALYPDIASVMAEKSPAPLDALARQSPKQFERLCRATLEDALAQSASLAADAFGSALSRLPMSSASQGMQNFSAILSGALTKEFPILAGLMIPIAFDAESRAQYINQRKARESTAPSGGGSAKKPVSFGDVIAPTAYGAANTVSASAGLPAGVGKFGEFFAKENCDLAKDIETAEPGINSLRQRIADANAELAVKEREFESQFQAAKDRILEKYKTLDHGVGSRAHRAEIEAARKDIEDAPLDILASRDNLAGLREALSQQQLQQSVNGLQKRVKDKMEQCVLSNPNEGAAIFRDFRRIIYEEVYAEIREVIKRLSLTESFEYSVARRRLESFLSELQKWSTGASYKNIAEVYNTVFSGELKSFGRIFWALLLTPLGASFVEAAEVEMRSALDKRGITELMATIGQGEESFKKLLAAAVQFHANLKKITISLDKLIRLAEQLGLDVSDATSEAEAALGAYVAGGGGDLDEIIEGLRRTVYQKAREAMAPKIHEEAELQSVGEETGIITSAVIEELLNTAFSSARRLDGVLIALAEELSDALYPYESPRTDAQLAADIKSEILGQMAPYRNLAKDIEDFLESLKRDLPVKKKMKQDIDAERRLLDEQRRSVEMQIESVRKNLEAF